jgi:hypothetical protein
MTGRVRIADMGYRLSFFVGKDVQLAELLKINSEACPALIQ